MVDVNPFDRVMNELKSRGRKNAHILSILQFDWPASEAIIEKLSCYITDGIKANQEPVIYPIIEEALHRYSQLVFHEQREKYEDPARIGAFLETLITETCRALEVQIVDSGGDSWSVDSGESFSLWLSSHPGELSINPQPHEDETSLRGLLYELITCESVKTVLRRTDYEEAVVAGRMAAGYWVAGNIAADPWRLDRQSHQKGIRAGGTESWCRSKRLDTEQSIYLVQVERYWFRILWGDVPNADPIRRGAPEVQGDAGHGQGLVCVGQRPHGSLCQRHLPVLHKVGTVSRVGSLYADPVRTCGIWRDDDMAN
nr:hypothetical protein LOCMHKOF_00073 [Providencia stuartii]